MNHNTSQAGFSLIESLVAVAILGLTLPLLFQSVHSAVGLISMTERRAAEWRVADDLITEATATLNGKEGTRTGRVGDLTWSVEATFADKVVDGGLNNDAGDKLFHVRVMVRPASSFGLETPVTLDTLRLWIALR